MISNKRTIFFSTIQDCYSSEREEQIKWLPYFIPGLGTLFNITKHKKYVFQFKLLEIRIHTSIQSANIADVNCQLTIYQIKSKKKKKIKIQQIQNLESPRYLLQKIEIKSNMCQLKLIIDPWN